jgi:hypothetical protein
MRDAGYVIAGFVLTGGVVGAYALSVRVRLRRILRRLDRSLASGVAR